MPPDPLTNFEIKRYYQNKPRFDGVFSRNNLPTKMKDGAYVINLMNMQMWAHIGLLHFLTEMKFFWCCW